MGLAVTTATTTAVEASTSTSAAGDSIASEASADSLAATIAEITVVWVDATAVAAIDEATAVEVVGGVEAVAERAPEEAVAGQPGIAVRPTGPVPAGVEVRDPGVLFGEVDIGIAEILRAQAAPVVEVVFGFVLVEALRSGWFACEDEFMTSLDVDGLDVGLEVFPGGDADFAVEDADGGGVGVEGVETVLESW